MSLTNCPLPKACEKEVRRLIARLSEKDLNYLVKLEPAFKQGGFRIGKPELLRTRLEQIVLGSVEISDRVREVLASRSRARTLTELLSVSALKDLCHDFATLIEPAVFLVAVLLDSRKEARTLAESWLSSEDLSFFQLKDRSEAAHSVQTYFGDLLSFVGPIDATTGPSLSKESWRAQKEKLDQKIHELQLELHRLKGVEDRARMYSQKAKQLQETVDKQGQNLSETEKQLRTTRQEKLDVEVELGREKKNREDRLSASIDIALSKEFYGWLHQAKTIEKEVAVPESDLLVRAEEALKLQAKVDRHSGNRKELSDRLDRLLEMRRRVDDALSYAIRQEPSLQKVSLALENEIDRISAILAPSDSPESEIERTLSERICQADINGLPGLRKDLTAVLRLHLLSDAAVKRLQNFFHQRLTAVHAVGVPELNGQDWEMKSESSRLLGLSLAGHGPLILLLDGHNVLFGLPARYNPPRGRSRSDAEKRDCVVQDVVRILEPAPAVRAWILFDGSSQTEHQAAPNIRVSYSGGEGEHRADKVLLMNIGFLKKESPDIPVLMVSDDQDLCAKARRLGAKTIPVLEYGAFLLNPESKRSEQV